MNELSSNRRARAWHNKLFQFFSISFARKSEPNEDLRQVSIDFRNWTRLSEIFATLQIGWLP
jgi:hypothetical protein